MSLVCGGGPGTDAQIAL